VLFGFAFAVAAWLLRRRASLVSQSA
jgi:hypothetical protein